MPDRVRVLLDEGVPEKLRLAFSDRLLVETVRYRGWTGLRNGDLLRAAAPHFDALVTVDKRLHYQQNVAAYAIAVVVLNASGTTYAALARLLPRVEGVLQRVRPGTVTVVDG